MTNTSTKNYSPCKFCGHEPRYETDPQYEDDTVSELYTYLECWGCHAQTKSFPLSSQAVDAWENGEYALKISSDEYNKLVKEDPVKDTWEKHANKPPS